MKHDQTKIKQVELPTNVEATMAWEFTDNFSLGKAALVDPDRGISLRLYNLFVKFKHEFPKIAPDNFEATKRQPPDADSDDEPSGSSSSKRAKNVDSRQPEPQAPPPPFGMQPAIASSPDSRALSLPALANSPAAKEPAAATQLCLRQEPTGGVPPPPEGMEASMAVAPPQ